ncbi:MAG TPA: hypothetical protein VLF39_03465 [Candidatus Saccharimonadales bacterium]|nr:hypothetical protein [Candidatus Saccharimonadales bacterium]
MSFIKKYKFIFVVLAVFIGSFGLAIYLSRTNDVAKTKSTNQVATEPLSYQIMQLQQTIIKEKKPPPTKAALDYAYVSSVYFDSLTAANQADALAAAGHMLVVIYPDKQAFINQKVNGLATSNNLGALGSQLSVNVVSIADGYASRYHSDHHDLKWNGVIPKGPGKWVSKVGLPPLTPRAGDWQRWVVNKSISVPPPPTFGSAQDLAEIANVKQVSGERNGNDVNIINFWGGTPGSETPAGIWQNQLYRTIKTELPADQLTADQDYAKLQKILAQTISDAFMECWKVKYTYWTARPDMRTANVKTAMKDPNFPGYVSGHSTISKAAADVLSVMVPKHAEQWEAMALEARNSRIKAGIHFEIDNKIGFQVGTDVADQVKANLHLDTVL